MTDAPSPTGLSASMTPVPITAINALSQAWRDALGYAKKRGGSHLDGAAHAGHAAASTAVRPEAPIARSAVPFAERAHVRVGESRSGRAETVGTRARVEEPRARRIRDLAEQIVHAAVTAAHVDLETEHGRIKLLVQQRGMTTRIVAVCPPEAHGDVTEALERVRENMVKRGITVDIQTLSTQGAA